MSKIFLLAGRTGGPFFPLPTIASSLTNAESIYIGIKNSFEANQSKIQDFKLFYLPDCRLTIFTFKKERASETVANFFKFFGQISRLVFSYFIAIYLLIKHKPKMIYSTGSFLVVPMAFAAQVTNFFRLTSTKLVIHQQDPEPGLSHKLTIGKSDFCSCVFEYTKTNYPKFKNCFVTPNPINPDLYTKPIETIQNLPLKNFLLKKSKPILLVFGGGSGSQDINEWLIANIEILTQNFKILHLTGVLQKKNLPKVSNSNYFQLEALFSEMPIVLNTVDLVLCRSGLASISELMWLNKPAFLVPLPHSHQELNAKLVEDSFYILDQKDRPSWVNTILQNYPVFFEEVKYLSQSQIQSRLDEYYLKLNALLESN